MYVTLAFQTANFCGRCLRVGSHMLYDAMYSLMFRPLQLSAFIKCIVYDFNKRE